jgi:peptide methionine sulfoxide reductase MsrA
VQASAGRVQAELTRAGYGNVATEIALAGPFYFAEDYYRQHFSKNPEVVADWAVPAWLARRHLSSVLSLRMEC